MTFRGIQTKGNKGWGKLVRERIKERKGKGRRKKEEEGTSRRRQQTQKTRDRRRKADEREFVCVCKVYKGACILCMQRLSD